MTTTGERAPEFDLAITHEERVRLSDFRGRSNVLLVFHPFAFTPVCEDEARDLQENLESFRNAQTEIVFVSCDPSAARQAWKKELGARVHVRLGLLAARGSRASVRRLQRGDRRAVPRNVPDRQGRQRDLVARQAEGRAAHGDGPGVARRAPRDRVSLHLEEWGPRGCAARRVPARRHESRAALREAGRGAARLPRPRARPARPRLLAVRAAVGPRDARPRRRRDRGGRSRRSSSGTPSEAGSRSSWQRGRRSSCRSSSCSTPRSTCPRRSRSSRPRTRARIGPTSPSRRGSTAATTRASSRARRGSSSRRSFAGTSCWHDEGGYRYRYSQSAVVAAYGEMASEPPPFERVRIPTLLVLGETLVPPLRPPARRAPRRRSAISSRSSSFRAGTRCCGTRSPRPPPRSARF